MKIPYGIHYLDKKDIESVSKALRQKFITQGRIVEKFEKKICKLVKCKYAVAVSSCTAGLHIAIAAVDKNRNRNEIITSPISFVSTANTIIMNNYKVNFADINSESLNLDYEFFSKKIKKNKKTNIVIPVHLGGLAADSKKIYQLCKKKKISIIEDAAHSFGGKYEDGKMVGSCKNSDMTVFSFHPVKTVTTGEGGVVTTNSKILYQKLLMLRNHGIVKNKNLFLRKKFAFTKKKINPWYYEAQEIGFNYRITDFQCALGISQIKKIKSFISKRKKIANKYDKEFKNIKNLKLPQFNRRVFSSNHLYVLNIDFDKLKFSKNELMKYLLKKGITTQVHYIPIPLHPFYSNSGHKMQKLRNATEYYKKALSIPIFFNLSEKDQKKIIKIIKDTIK